MPPSEDNSSSDGDRYAFSDEDLEEVDKILGVKGKSIVGKTDAESGSAGGREGEDGSEDIRLENRRLEEQASSNIIAAVEPPEQPKTAEDGRLRKPRTRTGSANIFGGDLSSSSEVAAVTTPQDHEGDHPRSTQGQSQPRTKDKPPTTSSKKDDEGVPRCPRNYGRKEAPFIKARGLTLTFPEAKLYGLVDKACSTSPPPPGIGEPPASTQLGDILEATRKWEQREMRQEDVKHREHIPRRNRSCPAKYSASRMEELARPVRGNRVSDVGRGKALGDEELTFTWKRSRRAEAALRDPACGYDFVQKEGDSPDQKGFLVRLDAYSSYARSKLETRRAEEAYTSRLDKLHCPR